MRQRDARLLCWFYWCTESHIAPTMSVYGMSCYPLVHCLEWVNRMRSSTKSTCAGQCVTYESTVWKNGEPRFIWLLVLINEKVVMGIVQWYRKLRMQHIADALKIILYSNYWGRWGFTLLSTTVQISIVRYDRLTCSSSLSGGNLRSGQSMLSIPLSAIGCTSSFVFFLSTWGCRCDASVSTSSAYQQLVLV